MIDVVNTWGQHLGPQYEISDIKIGNEYQCNSHVEPRYLENDFMTCTGIGKKRITMVNNKYPEEKFYIYPSMLVVKE